jgi:hypothetical protein
VISIKAAAADVAAAAAIRTAAEAAAVEAVEEAAAVTATEHRIARIDSARGALGGRPSRNRINLIQINIRDADKEKVT